MCLFLPSFFYSESTGRLWTSQIKVYYEGMDHPARIRIEINPNSSRVVDLCTSSRAWKYIIQYV